MTDHTRSAASQKCARCGDPEFRVGGYCSCQCADMHDVEQERDDISERATALEAERDALIRERDDLRQLLDKYDTRMCAVRNALTDAGAPEHEDYPANEQVSTWEASLRSGGRMIPQDERVRRIIRERDDLRSAICWNVECVHQAKALDVAAGMQEELDEARERVKALEEAVTLTLAEWDAWEDRVSPDDEVDFAIEALRRVARKS